ncbi:MAG TPA: SMC-Scp complex subunit ScpB [Terracidiphilus sp.]|nr:SMC-Scp complex subunit ScpB [Terracidiphilus sp.]
MSLKAKLEAVIYAAEEPVTLNQLAVLFADEALEWRAEQEKAAAEAKASAPAAEPLPFTNKAFGYLEIELTAEIAPQVEEGAEVNAESAEAAALEAASEPGAETQSAAVESSADSQSEAPDASETTGSEAAAETAEELPAPESPELSPEEAAKQAARQRDREVRLVIREMLDELIEDYSTDARGIEIREIAGGYRMATKPEYHDAVRSFVKSLRPAFKLSLPALETLAVIAYKQPVTAPEVNEIRGVDSSGVFGSLLARKLIATSGRKQVVGRPILYKTTKEFLLRFGLKDLAELPSMEEFEKMAASEFEETEAADSESELTSGADEADAEVSGEEVSSTLEQETDRTPEATPEPEAASTSEEGAADTSQNAVR